LERLRHGKDLLNPSTSNSPAKQQQQHPHTRTEDLKELFDAHESNAAPQPAAASRAGSGDVAGLPAVPPKACIEEPAWKATAAEPSTSDGGKENQANRHRSSDEQIKAKVGTKAGSRGGHKLPDAIKSQDIKAMLQQAGNKKRRRQSTEDAASPLDINGTKQLPGVKEGQGPGPDDEVHDSTEASPQAELEPAAAVMKRVDDILKVL
jgi:hypothetical protein